MSPELNRSGIVGTTNHRTAGARRGLSRFAALATATALSVGAFTATAHATDAPTAPAHAAKPAAPKSAAKPTLTLGKLAPNRAKRNVAAAGWTIPTELTYQASDGTVEETQGTGDRVLLPQNTNLFRTVLNIGDVDGDGSDDVLTISASGHLQFVNGNGGGGTAQLGGGWQIYNQVSVAGDLTGDGRADLVARDTTGKLWLYPSVTSGGGVASFGARKALGTGWNGYDQLVGVSHFDSAVASLVARDYAGNLWLYDLNSSGAYSARKQIGTSWNIYNQISSTDINGDGHSDLIGRTVPGVLNAYVSNGTGGTAAATQVGTGWYGLNLIGNEGGAASWGKSELIGRMTNGDLYTYYGRGNGTVPAAQIQKAGITTALLPVLGDAVSMDDTGYGTLFGVSAAGDLWNLYSSSGSPLEVGVGYTKVLGPGDINGDGKSDLLARSKDGHLYFIPGNGAGGLYSRVNWGAGWNIYNRIFGAGDLTGDGVPDLFATTPAGGLYLYPSKAGGGFGARKYLGAGWQTLSQVAAPGDLNGDGKGDLVGVDSAGKLWLYAGIGQANFKPRVVIGTSGWNHFHDLN